VNPGLSYSSISIYFGELPDWLFCHPTTNRLKNNPKIIPGLKPGQFRTGEETRLCITGTCSPDSGITDGMLLVADQGILVTLN
jgi:hypothetical protein